MKRNPARLLIVDDEFSMRDSLAAWFQEDGHDVVAAESAEQALRTLDDHRFDVALLDIKMPGIDGVELLERVRVIDPSIRVIMITAYATVETAVRCLKHGAFDYITKPVDPDELTRLVARALEDKQHSEGVTPEPPPSPEPERRVERERGVADAIIGESPAILHTLELIRQVAATDATVLIRGESGTGKELIARAVHRESPRRYFSLISVNCGALPESLLESELFGHEKGAFTGALYRRKGKGTYVSDHVMAYSLSTILSFSRTFRDITGESPSEARARLQAEDPDLSELPACLVRAAWRPDLRIAVSEKRRLEGDGT